MLKRNLWYKICKTEQYRLFLFSETLQKDQLKSQARKALKKLQEAKEIQNSIDNNKQLPMKFRINNVLIDIAYSYQTKLGELSDEEALKLVESAIITGREGFFCIKSSENWHFNKLYKLIEKRIRLKKYSIHWKMRLK